MILNTLTETRASNRVNEKQIAYYRIDRVVYMCGLSAGACIHIRYIHAVALSSGLSIYTTNSKAV
jgi:hypothetical protein